MTTIPLQTKNGGGIYSKSIHDALANIGRVEAIVLSEHQKIKGGKYKRLMASIAKSIFSKIPPNILSHSGAVDDDAKKIIKQSWDLIVIDHLEASCIYQMIDAPALYVSHNIEHRLFKYKIPSLPSFFQSIYSKWLESYENKVCKRVDGIVTISSEDARWLESRNSKVATIPPSFAPRIYSCSRFSNGDKLIIGFLGGEDWPPNREAIDVLLSQIIPLTQRKINLIIAGRGWDHQGLVKKYLHTNNDQKFDIKTIGVIDDIAEFWSLIDLFVAPIKSGEGVNVKVCESLAYGCPVLAFNHALRGIDGIPRELVMSASDNLDFASILDSFKIVETRFHQPDIFKPEFAINSLSKLIDSFSKHG